MADKITELADYIPKKDVQQDKFLKKYPEYDGRGLVIAIIDDGIDVSLPGMQKTTTVLDCIVWFDGEKWQACCDTSYGKEDLGSLKVLTNYCDNHEFDYFLDDISYCVTICNNGNLLKIFACTFDHGTAVAHTAAAYFPEEPERNGLAPGAQIVSMNMYDGNSEAMNKALLKCIELKVDIVNLSIGFYKGHEKLVNEMIKKHEIIFVNSAGNEGPSYSSLLKDEHLYNLFFVGSVLTSEMKHIFCNVEECNEPPTLCLWSSRGPRKNGSRGITLSAPGGVITSVPKWRQSKNEMLFGTSFAAPIAAGSIACLISALKASSIKYSPTSIRMALCNTAYLPDEADKLGYGDGIIQIYDAFEYFKNVLKNSSKLQLSVNMNGIFLIQKESNQAVAEYFLKVNNTGLLKKMKSFNLKLIPENAEAWIHHPKAVTTNSFNVRIDTNQLKPGTLNYAEIQGYVSNNSFSLFHFPITVIVPEKLTANENYTTQKEIILKSRIPYRIYIKQPNRRNRCNIKITALEEDISTDLYVLNALKQKHKILSFTSKEKIQNCLFRVGNSSICEIIICHSNLSNGETTKNELKFNVEISFEKCKKKNDSALKKGSNNEAPLDKNDNLIQKTSTTSFMIL